jgi:hypothetical protein
LDKLDSSARVDANDDDTSDRIEEFIQDVDIPATLEAFAEDDSAEGGELRQLLVRRWAESDASSAAAWASQCPEGPIRRAMLEQVAIAWANTDLAAAASWVRSLPQGGGQQAALLGVA